MLMADDSKSEFYEPSESNAYQGKLFMMQVKKNIQLIK